MKEIIKVELKSRKVDFTRCRTDLLCVGLFSDAKGLDRLNRQLNERLEGAIEQLIKLGDFKGKEGTSAVIYGDEKIDARRIILVGLGDKKKVTLDTVRNAAADVGNKAVEMKVKKVSMAIHKALGGKFDYIVLGKVLAEGVYFGSYRYDEFVTKSENGRLGSLEVELIDSDSAVIGKLKKGSDKGAVLGRCQNFVRTIANRPGNVINPLELAKEAKSIARVLPSLSCTVFDEKQLKAKGMGGILAVGSGSKTPPRLIVLKYSPSTKRANMPTVGLVGKAITFDAGGISLKPPAKMDEMKFDKSGGIAVLGTMRAVAELKLPLNVYGIIPSAENMPSGTSYRPGDIVKTYSGRTVEVLDTDAEGRMVLCDALAYAAKQKCNPIIDIATLTGACLVALGHHMAALMGNDEGLIRQLQTAANDSGEKVWHMPSGEEYLSRMKSKIADLRNLGGDKYGDACNAAAFLGQFIGDTKWAHIDMAGMDIFKNKEEPGYIGSPGFGVRLLTTYMINLTKK